MKKLNCVFFYDMHLTIMSTNKFLIFCVIRSLVNWTKNTVWITHLDQASLNAEKKKSEGRHGNTELGIEFRMRFNAQSDVYILYF